ncbi:hypothetical protein Golob_011635 [Gossypium lobatum]|uniref:Uncharacterized protein n=1 Tax=Gossypium lobatum TaxID=34289 RepID=A0A7J8MQ48_9ROSI|nr:hypothetical protein [Gossypium lobatum]
MNEMQNLQGTILVNVVDGNDGITKNKTSFEARKCSNNKATITDILMKLEADDESKVKFSHFTGLHAKRKVNPSTIETIYIMFCAFVKEMTNLRHEQVTEGLMLKWRDAIKNVLRINFKVDFAMEHLKKISFAYISSMERQILENVGLRISKLEAKLSAMKVEHAKISEQSKVFIDAAEEFNWNPVRFSMFKRPGQINVELELTNESDSSILIL